MLVKTLLGIAAIALYAFIELYLSARGAYQVPDDYQAPEKDYNPTNEDTWGI